MNITKSINAAIDANDTDALRDLLQQPGFINWTGYNHVHRVVIQNKIECLKILIEHNAPLNVKDSTGLAAIHYACESSRVLCMKLLLENGADPNIKYHPNGNTPLHIVAGHTQDISMFKMLLKYKASPFIEDNNGLSVATWTATLNTDVKIEYDRIIKRYTLIYLTDQISTRFQNFDRCVLGIMSSYI